MKIAIVIGHTSDEQGAYGNVGLGEWEFNDELLTSMFHDGKLNNKHEYYFLYRSTYIQGYKAQMVHLHNRIDNIGCELSLEFHFNSYPREDVNGNEVLYCSDGGKYYADIMDECLDVLPNRDRGVKKVTYADRGGGFCCRGKSRAIIVEPFFGAHQSNYVRSGQYRYLLEDAYEEFFSRI